MGSVLEQRFNGNIIASGAKVPWGSKIDLVIGSGLANENILVPGLEGLTYAEAKMILEQNGITLGATIPDGQITDTAGAFVWKQLPPRLGEDKFPNYIRSGQVMDLWISREMKSPIDSTNIIP